MLTKIRDFIRFHRTARTQVGLLERSHRRILEQNRLIGKERDDAFWSANRLEERLQAMTDDCDHYAQRVRELKDELICTRESWDEAVEDRNTFEERNRTLRAQYKALSDRLDAALSAEDACDKNARWFAAKLSQSERELDEAQESLDVMRQDLASSNGSRVEAQETLELARNNHRAEIARLKPTIEEQRNALSESYSVMRELSARLSSRMRAAEADVSVLGQMMAHLRVVHNDTDSETEA